VKLILKGKYDASLAPHEPIQENTPTSRILVPVDEPPPDKSVYQTRAFGPISSFPIAR
jgi:hypothetical protein